MIKRTSVAALAAAFLLFFATACGKANAPTSSTDMPKPQSAPASSNSAAPSSASSSVLKLQLTTDPAQPQSSKPTKFDVKVSDADGKPVTGAEVKVALVMKTMDMGKNEIKLADTGTGDYQGEGKFGMAGDWNVVVTAKQGDKQAQQTFPAKAITPKP